MRQKLYIGNLPYSITENDVRRLFRRYEPIYSVILIAERNTFHPRGFGFIELEEENAGSAARELNLMPYNGRFLKVCPAMGNDPKRAAAQNSAGAIKRRGLSVSQASGRSNENSNGKRPDDISGGKDGKSGFITYHRYTFDKGDDPVYCGAERHVT